MFKIDISIKMIIRDVFHEYIIPKLENVNG